MRMSTVILLVLALAGAGVSFAFWNELRAERALNAELSARLQAASAVRPPPPPPPPRNDPMPIEAPTSASAPAKTLAPSPETQVERPKVVQGKESDWRGNQRRLMSDPKYREAWREQQRLQMAQRRENYIEILGFTPQQADAAIELAIDRQMQMFERSTVSGSPDDVQRWEERQKADEGAYQAKLRDLLGAEKSARLQTYMESRQSRMQVDRLRSQLTGGDTLRDDQVEPLIAAMHAEQSQLQKDMQEYRDTLSSDGNPPTTSQRKYNERQAELMKVAHSRIHASASGILSGSQLEKLDTLLKRDLERLETQMRMQRIRSKLEQPNPATGPAGSQN